MSFALIFPLLAAVLFAGSAEARTSVCPAKNIEVVAHRAGAPELGLADSSLPAFLAAVKDLSASTALELDVNLSADRHFVISHDPYITSEYCTGFDGEQVHLMEHPLSALERLRCRSPYTAKAEKLLGLERLAAVLGTKGASHPLSIEIKTSWNPLQGSRYFPAETLVKRMVRFLERRGDAGTMTIYSFDPEVVELLRRERLRTGLKFKIGYYENNVLDWSWERTRGYLRRLKPDYYSPSFMFVGGAEAFHREVTPLLRQLNIRFVPWTLNDPGAWKSALGEYCADGIITDRPRALEKWLRSRRSPRR